MCARPPQQHLEHIWICCLIVGLLSFTNSPQSSGQASFCPGKGFLWLDFLAVADSFPTLVCFHDEGKDGEGLALGVDMCNHVCSG